MKNKKVILSMIILMITLVFYSCSDDQSEILTSSQSDKTSEIPDISENGQNPDDADLQSADNSRRGFIYLQSNDPGKNSVLVYRQNNDGTLTLQATVTTGGSGTGGGLGNQGAITIANDNWLFAVNAGSNSVSSFKIAGNGTVALKDYIETGGVSPVSVTAHGRIVYVVNAGSDNISGFRIGNNGSLSAIPNSIKSLSSAGAGAAQISFSSNGRFLYVTEKATNMITTFPVNNNGAAGDGSSILSTGQTPFGYDFARDYMIVSNAAGGAAGQSSVTSYRGTNSGNLSPVNGAVANNQSAVCWVATAKHGRFAFVTNTASGNISSYYVGFFGALYLIHPDIPAEKGPTEIIVSADNRYVYALNSVSHTISQYQRTILGGLTLIGVKSGLPNAATGIAAN
jgi:6-phosphogluconolactonase (cycloisomerase 2 family)